MRIGTNPEPEENRHHCSRSCIPPPWSKHRATLAGAVAKCRKKKPVRP